MSECRASDARKILVMRPGALGDTILTLPALTALRAAHPHARMVLAGNRHLTGLLVPRHVDDVVAVDDPRLAPLFSQELGWPEDDLVRNIDLAVLWLRSSDIIAERLRQEGARVIAAPSQPPDGTHVADYLLESLAPLLGAGPVLDDKPSLVPRDEDIAFAARLHDRLGSRPVAAIHPGSGGKRKCWPAHRFAELASALQREAMTVLLVVGPADGEAADAVLRGLAGREPRVITGASLGQLAAVLARCAVVVGNDSGVSHLAAAAGAPTVAIYGATDPAIWGIRGRQVAWIEADSLQAVQVGEVLDVALRFVNRGA